MAILNDNEFTEVEGRYYSNPQVALDENNTFIDNLRSTQQANNQEIQTQTYNLGSELPSQIGGLGAPGDTSLSYFTSRYQVPQTTSAVANLRATAQAAALTQVLENEQAKWKKRYNDAYRKYQKSAYDKANTPATTTEYDDIKGGVDENPTDDESTVIYGGGVTVGPGQQLVMSPDGIVQGYVDGEYVEIRPPKSEKNTGSYGMGWSGGGSGVGGVSGR